MGSDQEHTFEAYEVVQRPDPTQEATAMKIWTCKIGEVPEEWVPDGGDFPMRQAVCRAFHALTHHEATFVFSGWGGRLTEPERAVVENREPSDAHHEEWLTRRGLLDLAETAWVIIANANEGNWDEARPEWRDAATRWRDRYHAALDAAKGDLLDPLGRETS